MNLNDLGNSLENLAHILSGIRDEVRAEQKRTTTRPPADSPPPAEAGDLKQAREDLRTWAFAHGMTPEAWKGTAMGLQLSSTHFDRMPDGEEKYVLMLNAVINAVKVRES